MVRFIFSSDFTLIIEIPRTSLNIHDKLHLFLLSIAYWGSVIFTLELYPNPTFFGQTGQETCTTCHCHFLTVVIFSTLTRQFANFWQCHRYADPCLQTRKMSCQCLPVIDMKYFIAINFRTNAKSFRSLDLNSKVIQNFWMCAKSLFGISVVSWNKLKLSFYPKAILHYSL